MRRPQLGRFNRTAIEHDAKLRLDQTLPFAGARDAVFTLSVQVVVCGGDAGRVPQHFANANLATYIYCTFRGQCEDGALRRNGGAGSYHAHEGIVADRLHARWARDFPPRRQTAHKIR